MRFHDLRHTCASHLLMGTWGRAWKIEEVCAFLGHSDITVTQRYAHLSPDHLNRAAAETVMGTRMVQAKVQPGVPGVVRSVENPWETRSERATGIEPATFSLGKCPGTVTERAGALLSEATPLLEHTGTSLPLRLGGMHGGMHGGSPTPFRSAIVTCSSRR